MKSLQKQFNKPKFLFIAIDGANGAGKSTLVEGLASELRQSFPDFNIKTIEGIGTTPFGSHIRKVVKSSERPTGSPLAEGMLFMSSFIDITNALLAQSYDTPTIILCDRWYFSTMAHQGAQMVTNPSICNLSNLNFLGEDLLATLVGQVILKPDALVALYSTAEQARSRMCGEREDDRFEYSDKDFEFFKHHHDVANELFRSYDKRNHSSLLAKSTIPDISFHISVGEQTPSELRVSVMDSLSGILNEYASYFQECVPV